MFGHAQIKELCRIQEEIIEKVGKPKMVVQLYEINPEIKELVDLNGKKG